MADRSNAKRQRVKERLEQLIGDLDLLLADARGLPDTAAAKNSIAGEPDWILQIVEQREALAAVRALIPDSTLNCPSWP